MLVFWKANVLNRWPLIGEKFVGKEWRNFHPVANFSRQMVFFQNGCFFPKNIYIFSHKCIKAPFICFIFQILRIIKSWNKFLIRESNCISYENLQFFSRVNSYVREMERRQLRQKNKPRYHIIHISNIYNLGTEDI